MSPTHAIHGTTDRICVRHGRMVKLGQECPVCGPGPSARAMPVGVKRADAGLAAEVALAERMNDAGLVGWEPQYFWALDERSAKGRPIQYRSDFAFVKARLLIESEGGAHTVRRQYEADCRRASLAAALGWRMVRASKDMILDGTAVAFIARALNNTGVGAGRTLGKQGPGEAGSIPGAPANLDTHAAGAAGRQE